MTTSSWPIVVPARLEKGAIVTNRERLAKLLAGHRDGPLRITIEPQHAGRGRKANAYYWSVVLVFISDYTGYDVDETHEAMKAMFLPKSLAFCDGNGEVHGEIVIGGSTRKMNVNEFYDYVERVRRFAAEKLSLDIPDPDPKWREHRETAEASA